MVKVLWSALNSFSARLLCYLLKGPLKRDFLHICITTLFGARKLEYGSTMKVSFFLKMFKIFLVSEKMSSENVALNCLF